MATRRTSKKDSERRQRSRRTEDDSGASQRPREERRYPRRRRNLPVRVFRPGKGGISFEATIHTRDVSVGGLYLESTFFLRTGVKVEMDLGLPEIDHEIRISGEVAYVVDDDQEAAKGGKPTGIAIRFVKFHGDAELYLRAFLAKGDLYGYVTSFARRRMPNLKTGDYARLVEMIVRWEMLQEVLTD